MREINEDVYNEAVANNEYHFTLDTHGSTLFISGVLDTLRQVESILENIYINTFGIHVELGIFYSGNEIRVVTLPEDEPEEEEEEETNLELLESILDEFMRGSENHGWTWRSLQSIANNIDRTVEEITPLITENPEVFERSSNGRKYRWIESEEEE